MKKKLEAELVSIAHRILKLKGKEDVNKMHYEAAALYEKLSVLKFAHENFEDDIPSIGNNSSFFGMLDTAFNNKVSDNIELEDKVYVNLDEVEDNEITEPLMETIKGMVAQMPQETSAKHNKSDLDTIISDFKEIPVFEPVTDLQSDKQKTSLNDKLKRGGLNIGLNDKIAFTKHLFDEQTEDYNRVLSQLNTATSFEEAKQFLDYMVKPDYNNWEGKEEFETRLLELLESRFN